MEKITLQGKVIERGQVITSPANPNWKKQEFVLYIENTENPKWSEYYKIGGTSQRADLVANIRVGFEVSCTVFPSGKKIITKAGKTMYITEMNLLDMEIIKDTNEEGTPAPPVMSESMVADNPFGNTTEDNDTGLPF